MNKIKVYLDTSVISYLDQKDSPERMKETHDIWELFKKGRYEIYISDVVAYEINKCSREKRDSFERWNFFALKIGSVHAFSSHLW